MALPSRSASVTAVLTGALLLACRLLVALERISQTPFKLNRFQFDTLGESGFFHIVYLKETPIFAVLKSATALPFGVYLVVWFVTQGAFGGCAAKRPWALECNAFGVKIATLFDIGLPLIPSVAHTRGDASGNASRTAFSILRTRSQA